MPQDGHDELPGLRAAVEVLERHVRRLHDEGSSVTADGHEAAHDPRAHEIRDARHGALVAVRDDLYARIADLGGQWAHTEVGDKQPPTGGPADA